jgi:hypothetical protein
VFAGCAAVSTCLGVALAAPLLGYGDATAFCALALVVLHPLFVAPSVERGVAATLVTAALAVPIAWVRPAPFVAFLGMAALLGVVRSALLYPQSFPRALLLEAVLAGVGLGAVLLFHDGSLVGSVFSMWSFWLIQAGFALRAVESSSRPEPAGDPFDRAHAAAVVILEQRR